MAAQPCILPLTARVQSWAAGRLTIFGLSTGEAQPPPGNARRGQGGPRGVREKRTPLGGLPPVGPGALPLPQRGRGSGEGEGENPRAWERGGAANPSSAESPRLAAAQGEARSTSGGPAPQRKSPGAERHTDGAPAPPSGGRGPANAPGRRRPTEPTPTRTAASTARRGRRRGGPGGRTRRRKDRRSGGRATRGSPHRSRRRASRSGDASERPRSRGAAHKRPSGGAGGDTGGGGRRAARPDERARDGAEVRGHGPELSSEEWPNKGPRRPRPTPKAGATGDRPHTTDARGAGRVARGAPAPGTGAPRTA